MKRFFAAVAVVVILMLIASSPGLASLEDFVKSIDGTELAYTLRDTLLITCKYTKASNSSLSMAKLTEQYKDSLSVFKRILILFMKDDSIYLAVEFPLDGGVFAEYTGNSLMSSKFIFENMKIGD